MVSRFEKPYIDSSFFFAHIKGEEQLTSGGLKRREITQHILEDAEAGNIVIFTSAITIAEVRRIKNRPDRLDENELLIVQALFEHEYIKIVDVTRDVAEKAQILGANYGIQPMDAIHLASAIWWECDVLLIWDKPFIDRLGSDSIEGVYITEPFWMGQSSF